MALNSIHFSFNRNKKLVNAYSYAKWMRIRKKTLILWTDFAERVLVACDATDEE